MKHKRLIGILCAFLLVALMIPTAYAYMVHKSQTVSNVFIPGRVTCDIHETFENNVKKSITVQNTGNVDAYIRVRLVFYWQDSKGNIVARDMPVPDVTYNKAWIRKVSDDNEVYYYYPKPISPGGSTPNFLTDAGFSKSAVVVHFNGTDYTYYPVMEVLAEAIQSEPERVEEGKQTPVQYAWVGTITDGKIQ